MKFWRREVVSLGMDEILKAVKNDAWQRFRMTLKGLSTESKLEALEGYVKRREDKGTYTRVERVRVDNYINALLRGGQLVRVGNTIKVQR